MKKTVSILLAAAMLAAMLCTPVMAADSDVKKGFGVTGAVENITVTAVASSGEVVSKTVDLDGTAEETEDVLYINSDGLNVTFSAASPGGYYGIILVDGTGLPTKDNTIFYIDQVTASSAEVSYNVRPIVPTAYGDLTLYISTNVEGAALVKIPLRYDGYEIGNLNGDNTYDADDALLALQIGAELVETSGLEKIAADVNESGSTDSDDALRILQRGAELVTTWK